ncbi:MAG: hypothetical protein Q7T82_00305 [Armatimonadota bacterium]|nr:hypothetical protein [Armatimonadota bacterium]
MRAQRWFLDTSVIGGCHDEEYALPSRLVFREVEQGRPLAVISPMTVEELRSAPTRVQRTLYLLPDRCVEYVPLDEEATELAEAYVSDGAVGPGSLIDAQQVAVATLQRGRHRQLEFPTHRQPEPNSAFCSHQSSLRSADA